MSTVVARNVSPADLVGALADHLMTLLAYCDLLAALGVEGTRVARDARAPLMQAILGLRSLQHELTAIDLVQRTRAERGAVAPPSN